MLEKLIGKVKTIAISGHIRPDGDCVGACLALQSYLADNAPRIKTDVYLEEFAASFSYLRGADKVLHHPSSQTYDMFIALDASDKERLGDFAPMFDRAGVRIVIDHHITNTGFGQTNYVDADASSTCEILYTMMQEEAVSRETADCLYLGIVHDTGVFKHSNTRELSMVIAGKCITKGVNPSYVIDETFYKMSFAQNKALGLALQKSELAADGRIIWSSISKAERESFGLGARELDGIIDQLRVTEGTVAAVFLYELDNGRWKASLRSAEPVDVAAVARTFGGGGHTRAAGCDVAENPEILISQLLRLIEEQLS